MSKLEIRPIKTGLSGAERKALTFKKLRLERLEALSDGRPVDRARLGEKYKGSGLRTTSPTLSHMAAALSISSSTLRAYERGGNAPRWEIQKLVLFAKALGLTVEELAQVMENTQEALLKDSADDGEE